MADYLYGSAYVRTLESAIIGRERLTRLLNAKTAAEAYAMLADYGVTLVKGETDGRIDREATLLGILQRAYGVAEELCPADPALTLWRYPYDCNNLKAAIKCFVRGVDPTPMLFDFGTVPTEGLAQAVAERKWEAFPPMLRAAAADAADRFAHTSDPQAVDLILDRACYEDMLRAAEQSGNAFVLALVRTKLDLTNLTVTLRLLRMHAKEAGERVLSRALLGDGTLCGQALCALYQKGEAELLRFLRTTPCGDVLKEENGAAPSLSLLERRADDFFMEKVRECRFIPMGLEVMVAFLLAHECEVRNLRILFSGKEAGVDSAIIRERMRMSYV